jgi:hypothetical protein
MSPDTVATLPQLVRLRREIAADRRAMAQHEADAAELLPRLGGSASASRGDLACAATALHAWYTAPESILERIARQLDASVPVGDRWHQLLLSQSMAEVPAVRPAIISERLEPDLYELLGFRHFFRHAYAVPLNAGRLHQLLQLMTRIAPEVGRDLDRVDALLGDSVTSLTTLAE